MPWTATGKRLELLKKKVPKPAYLRWIQAYENVETLPDFEDSWATSEYGKMWTLFLMTIHKNVLKVGSQTFISPVAFIEICSGTQISAMLGLRKDVIPSKTNNLEKKLYYDIYMKNVGNKLKAVESAEFYANNTFMYEHPFRRMKEGEEKQQKEYMAGQIIRGGGGGRGEGGKGYCHTKRIK